MLQNVNYFIMISTDLKIQMMTKTLKICLKHI